MILYRQRRHFDAKIECSELTICVRLLVVRHVAVLIPSLCLFASDVDRVRELNRQILQDVSSKSVRRSAASASFFSNGQRC